MDSQDLTDTSALAEQLISTHMAEVLGMAKAYRKKGCLSSPGAIAREILDACLAARGLSNNKERVLLS